MARVLLARTRWSISLTMYVCGSNQALHSTSYSTVKRSLESDGAKGDVASTVNRLDALARHSYNSFACSYRHLRNTRSFILASVNRPGSQAARSGRARAAVCRSLSTAVHSCSTVSIDKRPLPSTLRKGVVGCIISTSWNPVSTAL